MFKFRNFMSAILASVFVVGFLSSTATAQGKRNWPAIAEPVNLAILIQDDLVGNVSNEMKITADFIRALPQGSQVMVGYITTGTLQVRQPFTTDLQKAADSLRIVISSTSASSFNPYVEVLEALRKFDSQNRNRNAVLLISDGLDVSRGWLSHMDTML